MALKFRRGTTAQKSGSLAFGEPYVNTTLGTLQVGLDTGDVTLTSVGPTTQLNILSISASSFVSASSIYSTNGITGSVNFNNLTNIPTLVSGSSQITYVGLSNIPSGIISSSAQIDTLFNIDGIVSGSSQITAGSTTNFANDVKEQLNTNSVLSGSQYVKEQLNTNSVVSSSSQITYTDISSIPAGIVSGSSQITYGNISSISIGIVSGSSQVTPLLPNGVVSGSSQVLDILTSLNTFSASNGNTSLNTYTSSLNNAIQLTGSTVSFLGNIVVYGTQSIINSENLAVADNLIYLNNESTITNPDLGIVGNYNDGTYAHSGIFRDASDGGAWKVFEGYTIEPSGTIDTTGNGFTLADFKADVITATSFNGTINATNGIVSGSTQVKNLLPAGTISGSSQVTGIGNAQLTNSTISGISLGSNLATLTISTGLSGTSYNGSGAVTIANTGVLSITTNTGLSSNSSATGNVTITNTGVTSLSAGTGVTLGATTGACSISIGQSVATSASPTFAGLTINGAITATGDITAFFTSDKRHKNNIQLIPNALEKVCKLNGVTWEWNDDVNEVTKSTPKTGLIAQEVQEVLPQVVIERVDGFLALDYSKMMGLMVEAIKEQQTQIHDLTLQIEELKKQKGL